MCARNVTGGPCKWVKKFVLEQLMQKQLFYNGVQRCSARFEISLKFVSLIFMFKHNAANENKRLPYFIFCYKLVVCHCPTGMVEGTNSEL